jgi:CRP/FNR family transcriptional regulator
VAPLYAIEGDNGMWQQENIENWLAAFPFFKSLSKEELTPFVEVAQLRFYKQKRYVFMSGDQLDRVFFIHHGKVKIYKTDLTGKEFIISVLEPGDMFPYTGFFSQGNFRATAEVLEDATFIVMPIKKFEDLLISQPKLCISFFKVLGDRMEDLDRRLEAQLLHKTNERIISLLIRLCQSNGEKTEKGYKLNTKFTNSDLAKMIGTSRESVCRTLNSLKKKDYVVLNEGFYYIDKDSLKRRLVNI